MRSVYRRNLSKEHQVLNTGVSALSQRKADSRYSLRKSKGYPCNKFQMQVSKIKLRGRKLFVLCLLGGEPPTCPPPPPPHTSTQTYPQTLHPLFPPSLCSSHPISSPSRLPHTLLSFKLCRRSWLVSLLKHLLSLPFSPLALSTSGLLHTSPGDRNHLLTCLPPSTLAFRFIHLPHGQKHEGIITNKAASPAKLGSLTTTYSQAYCFLFSRALFASVTITTSKKPICFAGNPGRGGVGQRR